MVLVASLAQTGAAQTARPASPMLEAAGAFLATLKPAQKAKAVLPFNSEERFHWFYTPVSRKGIPLKELNALQRQAGLALLRAGLSEHGYAKAQAIRNLEEVLREMARGSPICTFLPSSESRARMSPGAGAMKATTVRRTGRL